MTKKIVAGVLLLLLLMTLVGCGNKSVQDIPASQPNIEVVEARDAAAAAAMATEGDKLEIGDPLRLLATDTLLATKYGGVFLNRGNNLYTLNGAFARTPGVEYLPGTLLWMAPGGPPGPCFYQRNGDNTFSLGEVPIPFLEQSDNLIVYSSAGSIPVLELIPVNVIGYSYYVSQVDSNVYLSDLESGSTACIPRVLYDTVQVSDSTTGEVVEGDLVKNGKYTLSWYSGTEYHEFAVTANCTCYQRETVSPISLDGTLTKEGYALYDFGIIPPGLYQISVIYNAETAMPVEGDGVIIEIGLPNS